MKKLKFMGSCLDDIKQFPVDVRRAVGFELDAIQRGFQPTDWKAMKNVGAGVYEMRFHVSGEWRVIYVAKLTAAIYVLHAFQKKTQKTNQHDIEIARARYHQIGAK